MADTKTKTASGTLQMEVVPPAANKKVELDLDDAPFLQKEEEQRQDLPARPASRPPAKPAAPAPDTGAGKKKKLIIMAAAAGILLLVGAAAVWWFFLRSPAARCRPRPYRRRLRKVSRLLIPSGWKTRTPRDIPIS